MIYNFEWNPSKAKSNIKKHGVSFEEAATIFLDPRAMTIYDPDHSKTEERWITFGVSKNSRLLVVCHTHSEEDNEMAIIRIFSSRKANKNESKQYGE